MLRSETMSYYQLLIPREASYEVMNELGTLESVMIIDQHVDSLNKPFLHQVQRCDEILHKCEYLVKQLLDIGIMLDHIYDFQLTLQEFEKVLAGRQGQRHQFLNEIEEKLNSKYNSIQQQIDTQLRLKAKLQLLIESKSAMIAARHWFGGAYFSSKSSVDIDFDLDRNAHGGLVPTQKFSHFVGVMDSAEYPLLQRTIFRITKGNYMIEHDTLENQSRTCFLLIFPSFSLQSNTWSKIKKICDVLKVEHVSLPDSEDKWDEKYQQYDKEIEEIEHMQKLTQSLLLSILKPLQSETPSIQFIRYYLIKERALYENLNKVQIQQSIFVANMWIRTSEINLVVETLNQIKQRLPNIPAPQFRNLTNEVGTPPTHFKTNQFNKIFQSITETYGIPSYKEINPSIFGIITFPFLFGVMFGDLAHGFGILSFGLYLSLTKQFSPRSIQKKKRKARIQQGLQEEGKKKENNDEDLSETSSQQIIYDIRYMLILCGVFSIYCGLIYNEYFGFRLNLFGASKNSIYGFGLDPYLSEDMNFTNSVKMKLAIIIGFFQMSLGLICMGLNSLYFKDWIGLFVVFPAKMIFFTLFIGYMVFLILVKWTTSWPDTAAAPSIITTLVEMWMQGIVSLPMLHDKEAQEDHQRSIMVICAFCVPIILFVPMVKEIVHLRKHNQPIKKKHDKVFEQIQNEEENLHLDEQVSSKTQLTTMDIVVGCFIETMEFVLGCISNTASYLRLWALSLAHSQLAEVIFQLSLSDGIENASLANIIILFPGFIIATFGILLCMDSMECFLHALRLHWVEFQSKFFKGDGYLFQVYSFRKEMQQYQERIAY